MRRAGAPLVYVDAGDVAGRPGAPLDPVLGASRLSAAYRAFAAMGAAAVVPGEMDLALGLSLVRDEAASAGVAVLAANLRDASGGSPFAPSRTLHVGGKTLLLVGLVDPALVPKPLTAADPASAAAEAIASAGPVDLVIGVGHLLPETQSQLLSAVPRLDAVIAAHDGEPVQAVAVPGAGIRVRPASKGKALFRLDLRLADGFTPGQRLGDGLKRKQAGAAWARARMALATLDRQRAGRPADEAFAGDPDRSRMYAVLAEKAQGSADELSAFAGQSLFASAEIPLEPGMPEDSRVAALAALPQRGPQPIGQCR